MNKELEKNCIHYSKIKGKCRLNKEKCVLLYENTLMCKHYDQKPFKVKVKIV